MSFLSVPGDTGFSNMRRISATHALTIAKSAPNARYDFVVRSQTAVPRISASAWRYFSDPSPEARVKSHSLSFGRQRFQRF